MQNTSDQLQMWTEENLPVPTLSLSEALAKILVWLENEKGWKDKEVLLSSTPSDLSGSADRIFLSGKMLKGLTPQTLAQTFGELSKPLPTLGAIDLNGNCLIHPGFYPKIESVFTLSDILQKEVDETYFLSEKKLGYLMNEDNMQKSKLHPVYRGGGAGHTANGEYKGMNLVEYTCVAQRGRNPENPSDRTTGAHTEQRLEPNSQGTTNTLTGVQKDNLIMVKSNTEKGFEEAKQGDSINFSNPSSKTRRGRVGKGKAQTLDTACNQAVVTSNIRRLTEIECERLQGFPDNWTEYGDYDGSVKRIPKTQRYKLLGNAVTVDVVKAIAQRLISNDL